MSNSVNKRAHVDSGTLMVIDPCYLQILLGLTDEQEARWRENWLQIAKLADAEEDGIAAIPVGQYVTAFILTSFGGDGSYSPGMVAEFLSRTALK